MISDIVLERPLPPEIANDLDAHLGCVGGASLRGEFLELIEKAGFREVNIVREASVSNAYTPDQPQSSDCAGQVASQTGELRSLLANVTSVHVEAVK
jgi:hypothetical protein